TAVHWIIDQPGVIGLPIPGTEILLTPNGSKHELRVRGPNVTPGYWRSPELTKAAFDGDGFYRIGDAGKFFDARDATKGIVFDGRVAEDFKLSTGTWVSVGAVRVKLIAAADPLIQDAVITGHDRNEIGALVFLSPAAKDFDAREKIREALRRLALEGGSSTHPTRVLVMTEPPSIDANEITDKGYMNQRAVLERRAALVEKLYSDSPDVITS
ncbi:MAG TPA: feruloyl-CoA synthase, partial [Burkholderiales bacterium]